MRINITYVLKRGVFSLLSLYIIATVLFFLLHLSPGDPASALVSPQMTAEARQALIEQYGLDRPLSVQYISYISSLFVGDLGHSFTRNQPVAPLLVNAGINTLVLMIPAVILAYIIGPVIGAYFAWQRGSVIDTYGIGVVLLMWATPIFWTGMLALMIFSFRLGWFPSSGMYSGITPETYRERFLTVDFARHLFLPLIVTTGYWLAAPTFVMRNNMMDVLGENFIEMNRAEGLGDMAILYKHAARNSLLPVLHFAALAIGLAAGGSVLIEVVFSWPGLGRMMWQAVLNEDYPLAQGGFFAIAVIVVIMNFVVDIVSVYVDPRIAEEGA